MIKPCLGQQRPADQLHCTQQALQRAQQAGPAAQQAMAQGELAQGGREATHGLPAHLPPPWPPHAPPPRPAASSSRPSCGPGGREGQWSQVSQQTGAGRGSASRQRQEATRPAGVSQHTLGTHAAHAAQHTGRPPCTRLGRSMVSAARRAACHSDVWNDASWPAARPAVLGRFAPLGCMGHQPVRACCQAPTSTAPKQGHLRSGCRRLPARRRRHATRAWPSACSCASGSSPWWLPLLPLLNRQDVLRYALCAGSMCAGLQRDQQRVSGSRCRAAEAAEAAEAELGTLLGRRVPRPCGLPVEGRPRRS